MLSLLFLTMLCAIALPLVALVVLSQSTTRVPVPVRVKRVRPVLSAPRTPQQMPRPPSA